MTTILRLAPLRLFSDLVRRGLAPKKGRLPILGVQAILACQIKRRSLEVKTCRLPLRAGPRALAVLGERVCGRRQQACVKAATSNEC